MAKKPEMPPQERLARMTEARDSLMAGVGQGVLAMIGTPRYASLPVRELREVLLTPMLRNRVAVAGLEAGGEAGLTQPLLGLAIWANVSDAVDRRIRDQISEGVFPVRLAPDEWAGGSTLWLLDVIAPNPAIARAVVGNFRAVLKDELGEAPGPVRLHPVLRRMLGEVALSELGARPLEVASTCTPGS